MSRHDAVKLKVQDILAANVPGIQLTKNGGFMGRQGSTRVFIDLVTPEGSENTYVKIVIPLLFEVTPTPDLYEHIAFHSADYFYGALTLSRQENGKVSIFYDHTLLGNYLDEPELMTALVTMAEIADDLDDELKATFGGERSIEDDD